MNTRASGAATDDLGTSASVLSGLSALGSAPGSAALALFCVSETAEAHRTHCRLLSPGFSQRPFGDGQPRAREVEDDAGQLETWLGYSLVCESGASQVAQWWGEKKKKPHLPSRRGGFNPWVGKIPWRRKYRVAHSSILAEKIPWTEEPGALQFIGSQRVRHDLVTKTVTSA